MEAKTRCSYAGSDLPSGSRPRGEEKRRDSPKLKSFLADSERTRWQKLSSDKPFTTSSPPYLSPTVDPKLLKVANSRCTNKASMLRMQHQSQNAILPNADFNKAIKKNKNFELKSKILTSKIILSNGSEMSHGFLLGSRYTSIRTIDTNPHQIGGLRVTRNSRSNCFIGVVDSNKVKRVSSAPPPRIHNKLRPSYSADPGQSPSYFKPPMSLSVSGIGFTGENFRRHSAGLSGSTRPALSLQSPPPSMTSMSTIADTFIPTGDDQAPASSAIITPIPTTPTPETPPPPSNDPPKEKKRALNEEIDDENFMEENENDLLSPEAQKLTSQILMSLSRTSMGSRTMSQASLVSNVSENLLENTCPSQQDGTEPSDDAPVTDGEGDSEHKGESCSSEKDGHTTMVVVDMTHLIAALELSDS